MEGGLRPVQGCLSACADRGLVASSDRSLGTMERGLRAVQRRLAAMEWGLTSVNRRLRPMHRSLCTVHGGLGPMHWCLGSVHGGLHFVIIQRMSFSFPTRDRVFVVLGEGVVVGGGSGVPASVGLVFSKGGEIQWLRGVCARRTTEQKQGRDRGKGEGGEGGARVRREKRITTTTTK